MNNKTFFRLLLGVLFLSAAALVACGDDKADNGDNAGGDTPEAAYIRVTPATLTFDHTGAAVDGNAFVIESNRAWGAGIETGKEWVALSATRGENNGSITVTIPEPQAAGDRAEVTFATTDAQGAPAAQKVTVIQLAAPTPPPADAVTITVDFAEGAAIASPELPPYTKNAEEYVSGRHEYTIGGYPFAIYTDPAKNSKFYWVDNTQFFDAPEPNKGLYFSKEGAYIEFPAVSGQFLEGIAYTPTTSQGGDIAFEVLAADGTEPQYTVDINDDGSRAYTLLDSTRNTAYRIVVVNAKNAQCAKLVLTYKNL